MNHPLDETGFWNGVSHIYKLALIKEECCVCLRIFTADFWAPRPALLCLLMQSPFFLFESCLLILFTPFWTLGYQGSFLPQLWNLAENQNIRWGPAFCSLHAVICVLLVICYFSWFIQRNSKQGLSNDNSQHVCFISLWKSNILVPSYWWISQVM